MKVLRQQRDISQSDLARSVGCSRAYISQLETGSKDASSELTSRIASALGVDVSELTDNEIHPQVGRIVRVHRVNPPDASTHLESEERNEAQVASDQSIQLHNVPVATGLGIVWGMLSDARLRAIYGLPDLGDYDFGISPPKEDPLGDAYVKCSVTNNTIELTLTASEDRRVNWLVSSLPQQPDISHNNTLVWFSVTASPADRLQYLLHLHAQHSHPIVHDFNLSAEWQSLKPLLDI